MSPSVARDLSIILPAERAVLGAILMNADAFDRASALLTPDDLYRDGHRRLFGHMRTLKARGMPIDLVTLKDAVLRAGDMDNVGGPVYLAELTDGVPRSTNIEHYARIVLQDAATRRLRERVADVTEELDRHGDRDRAMASLQALLEESPSDLNDELLLEPAVTVAAREASTPPQQLVTGLLTRGCVGLWFGLERCFKSIATRAAAVAVASGQPVFGLARLSVLEPTPVAIVTEEDAAGAVLEHLDAFSDGRVSRGDLPLYLSACRGVSLDDRRQQDRLIRDLRMCGAGLVILEPLRSLTHCVDGTPRELQPFTAFVRRIIRDVGATVLLGHHAVKQTAGADARRGTQRVSGGGLVSICEAPVEFVRSGDSVTMTPRGFKHCATPPPLQLRLETQSGRVYRLVAEEMAAAPDSDPIEARVLEVVGAEPGLTSTAIVLRTHGRKAEVLELLNRLAATRRLRSEQDGKARRWYPE